MAGPCSGAHPALAGLVPALEAHYVPLQHVVWAACRPGARPLAALAWALVQLGLPDPAEAGDAVAQLRTPEACNTFLSRWTPPGQINVVVLDQFEEAFSQADPAERDALFEFPS